MAKAEAAMQQIDEGLSNAYTQLRELLGTFRLSIGDANLGEAISGDARATQASDAQAEIRLHYGLADTDLEAGQHIHILQLIREAVLNAIKHASAQVHIDVSCETLADGNIQVQISDDGVGIRDRKLGGQPLWPQHHE
jgi:two-component system nitrate/nitrite sensor histidine kinase NarQ